MIDDVDLDTVLFVEAQPKKYRLSIPRTKVTKSKPLELDKFMDGR